MNQALNLSLDGEEGDETVQISAGCGSLSDFEYHSAFDFLFDFESLTLRIPSGVIVRRGLFFEMSTKREIPKRGSSLMLSRR